MIAGGSLAAVLLLVLVIPRIAGGAKSGKAESSSAAVQTELNAEGAAGANAAGVNGDVVNAADDPSGTAAGDLSGAGTAAAGTSGDGTAAGGNGTVENAGTTGSEENSAEPRADFAVDPNKTNWNFDRDGDKVVYLTFDDGPSYLTMQFLDMLDACDVKATFFVTSQAPSYADCIQEAYRRGHTIGLHTSSHSFEIYKSVEDYFSDLEQIGNVVRDQIGYVPAFIRFPGGSSNTRSARYAQGIMATLSEEVQKRGYQYWDWNAETGDGAMVSVDEEIAEATSCEYNNIVMLAHDGDLKEATLEAMPTIIQNFKDRGYTFKALDREAKVIHHEVLN